MPNEPRQLLLSCLHINSTPLTAGFLPEIESPAWDEFAELAARQRIRPLLYHRLKQRGLERHLPTRVLEELRVASQQSALRNLRLLAEFGEIARVLNAERTPVIGLKGVHLIAATYKNVGLREIGDLDILVRREDLLRTMDVVRARGYRSSGSFSIDEDTATSHHLTSLVKDGTPPIEIHWNITSPLDAHAIDPQELWDRAVPWAARVPALGLCLEDVLLHLCYHASFHHHFRIVGLRPCCDIAAIVAARAKEVNWDQLVRRAHAWKWSKGVCLSLRLARDLVGADIPASTLDALLPDGITGDLVHAASDQIFSPVFAPGSLPAGVARLAAPEPALVKLQNIGRRIRRTQSTQVTRGPKPGVSFRRIWRQIARSKDLFVQHGRSLIRLVLKTDATLAASAERTNRIRSWLEAD